MVYIHRKRRGSSKAIWSTVEMYTKNVFAQRRQNQSSAPSSAKSRRLRSPKTPHQFPPAPSPTSHLDCPDEGEYVKLDESRWPLSGRCVQVGARIARGSYGDVYEGTLTFPTDKRTAGGSSRRVVIKTLNGEHCQLFFYD